MRVSIYIKKISSILLLMAIVMALFLLTLEILNLNKIAYGVKMANIAIGGKKTNEALSLLQENLKNFEISFKKDSETLIGILPENLGINFLLNESLAKASRLGKEQNIILGLKEQIAALFLKRNLPIEYNLNKAKLNEFVTKNFEKFEIPPQNARVIFNKEKNSFDTVPPEEGFLLQREKLIADLNQRVSLLNPGPVFLEFKKAVPEINEEEAVEAKDTAQNLISNSPYFIFYKDEKWKIDTDSFLDWVVFSPALSHGKKVLKADLSEDKIKDYLIQLAPAVNLLPQNAQLTFEENRVTAFSLSRSGRKLKIEESAKKIAEEIINYGKKEIGLEFGEIEPEITTSSIENLGIITLLGKGESNFAGSPKNRIYNIKTGLAKLQGTLIRPGEDFSFNETFGEVDEKSGFLEELVIKRDKTIPEYGGGICQVSTTLFRAAVNSGLEILERYPHAFPVVYYSPQGFDATVYYPRPDLRFKNDTPAHILIQGKITGTTLIFEFYGTSDGRKVIVSKPQEYDKKADGSMKAKFEREIWKEEVLVKKETFYSNYKSPELYPVER